jgi:hypothetical protein
MDRAVLVVDATGGAQILPSSGARLRVADPSDARVVRIVKAMAAALGSRDAVVVGADARTASARLLLVAQGARVSGTHVALQARYSASVLRALLPGSAISVSSLRASVPEVSWVTDDGGEVLHVPAAGPPPRLPAASEPRVATAPALAARAPVRVLVDSLPRASVGRGFARVVVLGTNRLRGVPLSDGDRVTDASTGSEWHYSAKALSSHLLVTLPASGVRLHGETALRPRAGARLIGVGRGDRVLLTLEWPGGESRDFDALCSADGVDWSLEVDRRSPVVTDELGICFGNGHASAVACVSSGGTWDRPCQHDSECPYYDPRRARGGCSSGQCEMPLGVASGSFRTAAQGERAMRHGCDASDSTFPYCDSGPRASAIFPGET